MTMWRIGTKIPINVYDGDRPVCQCQTVMDARLIVAAVNEHLKRILPKPDSAGPERQPRGTVYESSIYGAHCRHCGQTYDQHKAYPNGECQDAVRQG